MIGQAQTGTGKTAAFGIPLLEKMDPESRKTQAMVLCPTRELAIQVAEEIRRLAKYMSGIKVLPVYGGQEIVKQIRSLKGGVQIIVGTPGRVMDHMREKKTIRTDEIRTVVLDEADEMLNMGFLEDMETILSALPEERQTVMFSATMPQAIADIAKKFQKDPVMVRVVKKELTVPKVTQYYYEVKPRNKVEVMCRLLDLYSPKLSVAFCNTKKQVDELVQALQGRGYFAEGLHGDLKQEQRDRVMDSFRNGATEILVATDVAARGIDGMMWRQCSTMTSPRTTSITSTGSAGPAVQEGKAAPSVWLWASEVYKLRDIQRFCKTKIVPQSIPSLNDVTAIKAEKILDEVQEIMNDGELERMTAIIEKRLLAEDYSSLELAAAFLKMSMGDDYEDIAEDVRPLRDLEDLGRRGGSRGRDGRGPERRPRKYRGGRGGRFDDLDEYEGRRSGRSGMAKPLYQPGKEPECEAGRYPGEPLRERPGSRAVWWGASTCMINIPLWEVPKNQAEMVMEAMKQVKIRGKNVRWRSPTGNRVFSIFCINFRSQISWNMVKYT